MFKRPIHTHIHTHTHIHPSGPETVLVKGSFVFFLHYEYGTVAKHEFLV